MRRVAWGIVLLSAAGAAAQDTSKKPDVTPAPQSDASAAKRWTIGTRVTSLGASPNGKWLAAGGSDGKVRMLSPDGRIDSTLDVSKAAIVGICFSSNSRAMLTQPQLRDPNTGATEDDSVVAWDIAAGSRIGAVEAGTDFNGKRVISLFEILPWGRGFLLLYTLGSARMYDPFDPWSDKKNAPLVLYSMCNSVALSPDGRFFATTDENGLSVKELSSKKSVWSSSTIDFDLPQGDRRGTANLVGGARYSIDGASVFALATWFDEPHIEQMVGAFDAARGKPAWQALLGRGVRCDAPLVGSHFVAIVVHDAAETRLVAFDVRTGQKLPELPRTADGLTAACVTGDGGGLWIGTANGGVARVEPSRAGSTGK